MHGIKCRNGCDWSWVLWAQDLDEILVGHARHHDVMFPKTRVFDMEFQARFLSVNDGCAFKDSTTSSAEGLGSLCYRTDPNSTTADSF